VNRCESLKDSFMSPYRSLGRLSLALLVVVGFLEGCGTGDATQLSPPPDLPIPPFAVRVESGAIQFVAIRPGSSPFLYFAQLVGSDLSALTALKSVSYVIQPKPGTASKPVSVSYTISYLSRRGYVAPSTRAVTVPVIGLYAGYANQVTLTLQFDDGSNQFVPIEITTSPYTDPNNVYDHVSVLKSRVSGTPLGFDFFALKSGLGTPVVVDTDGNVRWTGPLSGKSTEPVIASSWSSTFVDNGFLVGDPSSTMLRRIELDGSISETSLHSPDYTKFHHNIDPGKQGLLIDIDAIVGGVEQSESNLVEIDTTGTVLKEWDLAKLVSDYMRANGDDPSTFVRPGVDWFHLNGAAYDKSDDSLVVSSRENFLMKLDYESGHIIWILGDPTKYWYTIPSLRAKAVTLTNGGLYPIGQHAPSITWNGLVMVFNNGTASFNQPTGQSAGQTRAYSAVSTYRIDARNLLGQEAWDFDYNQTISSIVCSSAYETSDQSILIDYAVAENATKTRLVGLNANHDVIFDFQYVNSGSCSTSWNAIPVPFEHLRFT
jgi:arylsulfate sulfotransferase